MENTISTLSCKKKMTLPKTFFQCSHRPFGHRWKNLASAMLKFANRSKLAPQTSFSTEPTNEVSLF